jgi:relaxase-like protein
MIGNLTKGKDFDGCLRYLFADKDHKGQERETVELLYQTVPGGNPAQMAKSLQRMTETKPDLLTPVQHFSMSWHPDDMDKMTFMNQVNITQQWAKRRGFDRYVSVSHGNHLHVVASRVNKDGKVVPQWQDYKTNEEIMREFEVKFNLVKVVSSFDMDKKPIEEIEEEMNAISRQAARVFVQDAIDSVIAEGKGLNKFVQEIREKGIETKAPTKTVDYREKPVVTSITYEYGPHSFKEGDLGKAYSFENILNMGIVYKAAKAPNDKLKS